MLKNFRAFELAKQFYQGCKPLKMPAHLKDQLMRASSSVALNLAESSGNRTRKEQVRFYTVALGSLRECEAILNLEEVADPQLLDLCNQLGAILYRLCQLPDAASGSSCQLPITVSLIPD
jgi:four helix bundle protein